MKYLITTALLCLPIYSQAAVVINEIAWMGNSNSANDEWIELYNNGDSSVSLDGWTLSDGMNLSISLAGTVGAGRYAVLERTDDSSAPGSASLIYTGALSNAGATLTLTRSGGGIEDSVSGGENWVNIGGDNVTKETAQYTSSGWVTGTPTPAQSNVSYSPPVKEEEGDKKEEKKSESDTTTPIVKKSQTSDENKTLVLPDVSLDITLTAPSVAYVHQPINFKVEPSGIGKVLLDSVQFTWNFGDLKTAVGRKVAHQYEYPGTYVVVIDGEFKRHSASVRHEITVLPVTFSITKNKDGDFQINNDSKYEVNLSGYSVRGDKTVIFPNNTILLSNSTLTIPKEKIGGSGYAWLFDQEAMIVASTLPSNFLASANNDSHLVAGREATPPAPQISAITYTPPATPPAPSPNRNFTFSDNSEKTASLENSTYIEVEASTPKEKVKNTALVNEAKIPIPRDKLPYLGLIGVLSLGILAMYATRVK